MEKNEQKALLKEALKKITAELANNYEDVEWYEDLVSETLSNLPESEVEGRSFDEKFFSQAFKHSDLHPFIKEAVETIMQVSIQHYFVAGDEEEAGTFGALLFALEDKREVPFYAYFLTTNDLDHYVNQPDDWEDIFEKWGICEETLLLMSAILLTPGQPCIIEDYVVESNYWKDFQSYIQKKENLELFIEQLYTFSLKAKKMDARINSVSEFLEYFDEEVVYPIIPESLSIDEDLVEHVARKFDEQVEGKNPTPPTLSMLMEGYNN
tara:strand:- start:221 stop:1021 length:801 start_codon:yes stop_codon:yes gene_type:complete